MSHSSLDLLRSSRSACFSGILTYLLLGGQTPFLGATDFDTLQNIRTGRWTFGDQLSHISPDARDFITRLLNPDQQNRLSSEQAVNHPWLRFALQHVESSPMASDRLQGTYSRQLYDVSDERFDSLFLERTSFLLLARISTHFDEIFAIDQRSLGETRRFARFDW